MSDSSATNSNQRFVRRYDTVIAFLGIEIVALIFFGFGGVLGLSILKVLGAFLAFVGFPFIENAYSKSERKTLFFRLIPALVFFLLLGLSSFWFSYYGSPFSAIVNALVQFLGCFGAFALGFVLRSISSLRIEKVIFGIQVGLALLVAIAGIYSFARYGLLYASRFAGKVYYFDGVVFPVSSETKALVGFGFSEVSLSFGMGPAFLLAGSGAGLFFLESLRKEWKRIAVFGSMAFLGVLYLAFVPYVKGLLLLAVVYLSAGVASLFYRLSSRHKRFGQVFTRLAYFLLMGVVAIGLILLFTDAKTGFLRSMGIPYLSANLASNDGFFGSIRRQIQDVLYGGAMNAELGKIDPMSLLFGYHNLSSVHFSSCFEFNVLYENGLLGFLLLIALLFLGIRRCHAYLVQGEDKALRGILIALLFSALLYYSVCADELPLVHESGFLPFTQSGIFLGCIAVCGYCHGGKPLSQGGDIHE